MLSPSTIPSPSEIRTELARRKLLRFITYTKENYNVNFHHEVMARKLDDWVNKKIPYLMIFMPPRHGKSEQGTRRVIPFIHGRFPDAEVISASYSDSLACAMSADIQKIMEEDSYEELFPNTALHDCPWADPRKRGKAAQRSDYYDIVGHKGKGIFVGVGTGVTGKGGDYIIADDLIKDAQAAASPTIRQNVWDWFVSTLYTRREGGASMLLIMTRWHEDDVAGRLLELSEKDPNAPKWEVVEFPMIKEDNSNPDDPRKIGEVLWPWKYDIKEAMSIKALIGLKAWTSLYQQKPAPAEGYKIKKAWLRYWKVLPNYHKKTISIDASFKGKEGKEPDRVSIQVWVEAAPNFYLIDRKKDVMSFTETLKAIKIMLKKHPDTVEIIIEDKANGSAIIDVLKAHVHGVIPVTPHESKEARVEACSPFFEANNVFLPHESLNYDWVADYENELLKFPAAKNDDDVDATSQYLNRQVVDLDLYLNLLTM